ncbi:MAG: branched-chain amino acid ABC transporter permease [Lachnospiraceae bacterium]|nr:branched-chain amino acid ABC transporter permease [Lachnospiraceae bacterium]
MVTFFQQLVNGISLGSVYALIAIGYTMVYGIIKMVNFAHGEIFMVGSFLGLFAVSVLHFTFFPALLFSMIGTGLIGALIEKVAYKPLRNSPPITLFITAIAISMLLKNLVKTNFLAGPNPHSFPEVLSVDVFHIGPVQVSYIQIIVLLTAVILGALLQYFVKKTKTGYAMRVVAYDKDAAALMGINVNRTITITFIIGSALAGAAGVLVGIMYPRLEPTMGTLPGLKCFVAAVLGGIGEIPGAIIGGIVIGFTETMTKAYISSSLADAFTFSLLIITLLVKPTGLLGKKTFEKV